MHRATRLAALLLPLPLLAGCFGADTRESTSEPAAVEAPPAEPAVAAQRADGEEFVDRLREAVEGIDTTAFTVRVTGPMTFRGEGEADLTTTPPSLRVRLPAGRLGVREIRVVDGVVYGDAVFSGRPDSGWFRLDLDALTAMLPVELPDLLALDGLADSLAASITDTDVDGGTWTAEVDPAQLLADLGGGDVAGPELSGEVTVTATYDEATDRLDAVAVRLGDLGSVAVTLSDQGEPVRITAPPKGRVKDFGDLWFEEPPGG